MWVRKKTQYGGDVVMFLPNKIITNKKLNYPQTNIGLAHGFKTTHGFIVHGSRGPCKWF